MSVRLFAIFLQVRVREVNFLLLFRLTTQFLLRKELLVRGIACEIRLDTGLALGKCREFILYIVIKHPKHIVERVLLHHQFIVNHRKCAFERARTRERHKRQKRLELFIHRSKHMTRQLQRAIRISLGEHVVINTQ